MPICASGLPVRTRSLPIAEEKRMQFPQLSIPATSCCVPIELIRSLRLTFTRAISTRPLRNSMPSQKIAPRHGSSSVLIWRHEPWSGKPISSIKRMNRSTTQPCPKRRGASKQLLPIRKPVQSTSLPLSCLTSCAFELNPKARRRTRSSDSTSELGHKLQAESLGLRALAIAWRTGRGPERLAANFPWDAQQLCRCEPGPSRQACSRSMARNEIVALADRCFGWQRLSYGESSIAADYSWRGSHFFAGLLDGSLLRAASNDCHRRIGRRTS